MKINEKIAKIADFIGTANCGGGFRPATPRAG
jgi:hypothetical protein